MTDRTKPLDEMPEPTICTIDGCGQPSMVTINAPDDDPDPFEVHLCQQHANSVLTLAREYTVTQLDANTFRLDKPPVT
jgi:hypothetical protein